MMAWLAFSAFEEAKLIECAERIEYTPLAAIGRFLPMSTVSLGSAADTYSEAFLAATAIPDCFMAGWRSLGAGATV
jgi:hypothetical protein